MQQPHKRAMLLRCGVVSMLLLGLFWLRPSLTPPLVLAQDTNLPGITAPAPGADIAGAVPIIGTAADPAFLRYELYFKPSAAGDDAYNYFAGADSQIVDGQLGLWETADLPPATYDLRMRVVRTDGNYTEYNVADLRVGLAPLAPTAPLTNTTSVTPTVATTTTLPPEPPAVITTTTPVTSTTAPTIAPTATTPPADPAAIPAGVAQIVTDRNLNVREGPGTDYPIVSTLIAGDRARITGQNAAGEWWQIAADNGGVSGWVLGRLVTAENVANVPVVEAAPLPAVPPVTAPVTTAVTSTVTTTTDIPAVIVSTAPVTGTSAVTTSGPVTVTLTGDVENSSTLRGLLRALLVSFSPNPTGITATVGLLPAGLPITLTVPQTATVIGSVSQTGALANDQLFLATAGTAEGLLAAIRQQLVAQGFTAAPAAVSQSGPGQVFLPSNTLAESVLFCSPGNTIAVTLHQLVIGGEPEAVSLRITSVARFGGICGQDPAQAGEDLYAMLPQLEPPPQSQVRNRGSGSSSDSETVSLTAEAGIETVLTAAALADHYEGQLTAAGWTLVAESRTDRVTWSAWSFVDANNWAWNASFTVVPQGSETGSYVATLRAERQP